MQNESRKEDMAEASQMALVMAKLAHIEDGVDEIKGNVCTTNEEIQGVRERLIKVESSVKSAHKRLDSIKAPSYWIGDEKEEV